MGLRSIELFAGAGGGCLASQHLLGFTTACYVEREEYAQRVLMQRIADGMLDDAPIWDDVRTFDARPWRGLVDVVCGGFPCQAFSTAARGRNNAPDLWPDMLRIVGECRPQYVFAENVQREPIGKAAHDLWLAGYSVRYTKLSAADLGAPHGRPRWWLVADADSKGEPRRPQHVKMACVPGLSPMAWWAEDISAALGMDDGMAHRMDRLKALGNGQVPIVAATAWEALTP